MVAERRTPKACRGLAAGQVPWVVPGQRVERISRKSGSSGFESPAPLPSDLACVSGIAPAPNIVDFD